MINDSDAFKTNSAPHIIIVTNHGVHEWKIVPGLKDTGGQNIFVNQFADALVLFGFKVTIVNRGGYQHPVTGKMQTGTELKNEFRRIVYIEDGRPEFVRKEDMHEQVTALSDNLLELIEAEDVPPKMIISHYWDAAAVVVRALERIETPVKHIWIPHSLGRIKKQKTTEEENLNLRMSERVEAENEILESVDIVVATSETVRSSLIRDYGFKGKITFIPPCIEVERYHPFKVDADDPVYRILAEGVSGSNAADFHDGLIVTEISRTDKTKRKDILIRAFAEIADEFPRLFLAITIDRQSPTGKELLKLIDELGIGPRVAVLGSVWEYLPALYNITDVYCSPSVMEGFGMSVQEAAACRTAVVASNLIPFAVEYLAAQSSDAAGAGALIVEADDIHDFAVVLRKVLSDTGFRNETAENAYRRTIPDFTWNRAVSGFFRDIGYKPERVEE